MTTHYVADHASALADIRAAGAAVTFTSTTQTVTRTSTGEMLTPSTATVAGYAIETAGDPEQFRALGLVAGRALALLFAPTTIGALPALDATVTWGAVSYVVKAVTPLAPDGTAILATVTVAR